MTAITVTPEIARVAFLRRSGRSFFFSSAFSLAIISAFDGIFASLHFAAMEILARLISS